MSNLKCVHTSPPPVCDPSLFAQVRVRLGLRQGVLDHAQLLGHHLGHRGLHAPRAPRYGRRQLVQPRHLSPRRDRVRRWTRHAQGVRQLRCALRCVLPDRWQASVSEGTESVCAPGVVAQWRRRRRRQRGGFLSRSGQQACAAQQIEYPSSPSPFYLSDGRLTCLALAHSLPMGP